jgi:hypothetical protein
LAKPLDNLRRRSSFWLHCFPQSHDALVLSCGFSGRPIQGRRKYSRHNAENRPIGPDYTRYYFRKLLKTDKPLVFHACSNPAPKIASHLTLSAINDFPARSPTLHGLKHSFLMSSRAYFTEICCGLARSRPLRGFPALIRMAELGPRFQGHGIASWLMSGDLPAPKTGFGAP